MNVFALDQNPPLAAKYHCDKHVVKMIVETMQMLASAVIRHGATPEEMPLTAKGLPLKGGYPNHPCTRWVGDTRGNYRWTAWLGLELCAEYKYRYGKVHSCQQNIEKLAWMDHYPPKGLRTPFAIAIAPDSLCRAFVDGFDSLDAVEKYRLYYMYDKKSFAQWTKRKTPDWFRPVSLAA